MESIDYRGYKILIEQDEADEDPTSWSEPADRGATFVLSHKRYNLPCEIEVDFDDYKSFTDMAERHPDIKGKPFKLVRWYEHSGVSVSLRDDEHAGLGFDAGIAGIIFGDTTEAIESAFNEWKMYIEGDVWRITVQDSAGEYVEGLSCIYGRDEAEQEGRMIVDHALTQPRVGHHPKRAQELHR